MRYLFLVFVLLVSIPAFGQAGVNRDVYGEASWFRSDIVPQDGIIGSWVMDPGCAGDVLQGIGSFEGTWQGASGGCTNCPQSATCACTPTSDIDRNLVFLYDYDTSAKMVADATPHVATFYYTTSFNASTCYQLSWENMGPNATEDMYVQIKDAGSTDYYNFATDAWQAGAASTTITNMTATWTKSSRYIKTGLVAKASYQIIFSPNGANQTFYLDGIKLEKLNSCNPQDRLGVNDPQIPITSDPNFGSSQNMSYRVGTGPAYKTGGTFNGISDYLSIADTEYLEPSNFPEKSLGVGCRVLPRSTTNPGDIFTKFNSGVAQISYLLNQGGGGVGSSFFIVSNDGSNTSSATVASSMFQNTMSNVLASYKYVTNGTSIINLYSNYPGIAVSTNNAARGPIFNGTANIHFGSRGNLSTWYDGQILSCDMYKRDLSAIEVNKWMNPYFPANNNGPGFYVNTCTQAAPEANCSYEKCRAGTPHGCQATGNGVMPTFNQYTELPLNNYFSLFAGDISDPTITNWARIVTGSGTITLYAGDSYYGSYSVRLKGGSADSSMITSACINTTASYYMYTSAFSKNLLERKQGRIRLRVYRYSDNACAVATTSVDSSDYYPDGGAAWSFMGFQNREVGSESIKVAIIADGNAVGTYDYLVDMVGNTQWDIAGKAIYYPIAPTTGATVTINNQVQRLVNPLSSYIESRSAYGYVGGFCFGTWVYTDHQVNDGVLRYLEVVDATAGSNNTWLTLFAGTVIQFNIYDGAGAVRSSDIDVTVGSRWSANGWHYYEACSSNNNTIRSRFYDANTNIWYNSAATYGAGTGIQNGQSSTIRIGGINATNSFDAWFFNFVVGPYSAIWPQYGFNPQPRIARPY